MGQQHQHHLGACQKSRIVAPSVTYGVPLCTDLESLFNVQELGPTTCSIGSLQSGAVTSCSQVHLTEE